ncbi:hypothetical protein [Pseudomonas sp. B21-028]|nr:hypothetical protein [Pseudomonas sp. B21-028]
MSSADQRCAAELMISGVELDLAKGATHYYAITMPKPPAWAKDAT